jgi:pimeloyl-ACP methyl ester carboxylesterase
VSARGDGFAPFPGLEPDATRLAPDGLFAFARGSGPLVVLVHGNGDEADTWRHLLGPLSASRRVVAPDLPGFGRSAPAGDGGLRSLAAALVRALDALDPERPVALAGSSLGAAVAALAASERPGRVSALALVGGTLPGLWPLDPASPAAALLEPGVGEAYYTGLRDAGQDAAYASLEGYYADLGALPALERAFLRERVWARVWSDAQRAAFFSGLRSLADASWAAEAARVATALAGVPALLVWGEHDRVVAREAATATLSRLEGARLEVIPGAGHLPHQERPGAVLAALEPFLDGAMNGATGRR